MIEKQLNEWMDFVFISQPRTDAEVEKRLSIDV